MNDRFRVEDQVRILIVDDEEKNLIALESILDAPDYALVKARNGADALRAVRSHDFAVIVLDVQMPEMNGFEVARLIKQRKRTSHTPILFLSAHYQAEQDALSGYGAGAVDYLIKPFDPSILCSKVAVFAELHRKSQALKAEVQDRREAEARIGELNRQLAERIKQLAAANAELESFTYAASHDMRAPLVRITSFSTLLGQKYRDRLDGDALVALDLIQQNAQRLSTLVEDLLEHAQVGQESYKMCPVDMYQTVQAVLHERSQDIRRHGAEVRVDLPKPLSVHSNPTALLQILRNLVDNALKYSCQARPPVIEIGGHSQLGICRLWVRDNGIGIAADYQEKIFEIFQRLHSYSEYPGSGIGLALVKKAAERLNGRVWVESEPGKGAAFYLELPGQDAVPDSGSA